MYPFFSNDGGVDSERTYITQLVQKYVKTDSDENLFTKPEEAEGDTVIQW